MLWKYVFYEPSSVGLFNTVLGWVHLGPYGWLQSPGTAMPALVVESTWANAGATVIIYLAALTAWTPICTTRRLWTAQASGTRSGTSRCLSCAACCSSP